MKTILTIMMTLMSVMVNAQELEGTYKASDKIQEMANEYVKNFDIGMDADINVGLSMFFLNDNINLIIDVTAAVEQVQVKIQITFMGTYVREGNHFDCTFNKDNMDVALMEIVSEDPEIRYMIENDADTLYAMVEGMIDEVVRPKADELFKICKYCDSFDITSQTENAFTALFKHDIQIDFTK